MPWLRRRWHHLHHLPRMERAQPDWVLDACQAKKARWRQTNFFSASAIVPRRDVLQHGRGRPLRKVTRRTIADIRVKRLPFLLAAPRTKTDPTMGKFRDRRMIFPWSDALERGAPDMEIRK